MPRYSETDIQTIKNRLRLSDVVGSYVRLTKQGSHDDFKACCPFHHEKTPSFIVHDDKGFYHCFGCGKSGDMFTFVSEIEHLSYKEAIESLAKKANVELKKQTSADIEKQSKAKAIQDLYNRITNSFHQILLNNPQAEKAREYLKKRGITDEYCEKFMLGYAPADSKWLYSFLKKNNYSDELLYESGLIYKEYQNSSFFTDRLLFPVRDIHGNTVAFSGRDLSGISKAKYKNSSASEQYSKKDSLFGFFESLEQLKKKQEIILCEGNFDVISMHQAGLNYTAAPLGTAFTEDQLKLIKRYCSKVYLLFDSDEAGQKATEKAIIMCQKNDIECRVIKPFSDAKDASQMLEEQGAQALVESCLNTDTGFSYLVHLALKRYDIRQPKGKSSVFKEVLPYLDATSSEIERQGYIKNLSEILKISEEQIMDDYKGQSSCVPEKKSVEKAHRNVFNPLKVSTELNAMLLLVNNRQCFDKFRREVKINQLGDNYAKMLYTVLENSSREEIKTDEVLLQMIEDEELRNFVSASIADGLHCSDDAEKDVEEAINAIKLQHLIENRNNILSLISSSDNGSLGSEDYRNMLEAKLDLDRKIEELKKNTEVTDN